MRKSGPNPNFDEIKKQTYDSERIKKVNELSDAAKKANPPAKSKITSHQSPKNDNSPNDEGDKVPDAKASAGNLPGSKTSGKGEGKLPSLDDTRTGGYRRNTKGPESTPAPSSIKVRTDDTPEELNFPGTND